MRQRPSYPRINRSHTLANGLVFAGLGGGASTSCYADASAYGGHGTLTNMDPPTDWVWDTTLNRFALDFDGSNDVVLNGLTPIYLAGATVVTLAFWGYRSSTSHTVIGGYGSTLAAYRAMAAWWSDGKVYVQFENGSTSFPYSALTGTGWHHFAVRYNGALTGIARVELYVDGVKKTLSAGGASPAAALGTAGQIGTLMAGRDLTVYGTQRTADLLYYVNNYLPVEQITQLADPSNVMLSGLVLPPRRRLFPIVPSAPTFLALWARNANHLIGGGVS